MIKALRRIPAYLPLLFIALAFPTARAEILIGIAGPLSGPVAQYGDMQFTGARLAIEHINASGGINGQSLVAVEADDACEPRKAVAAAQQLISQNVRFVVGHLCSSSTQPASDLYEEQGILMITPASTSPEITRRDYRLVFRTTGLDSMQGTIAAQYLAARGIRRAGIVHDGQQYGEGIARQVHTTLRKLGVDVPVFEEIISGERDFSALISRLRQSGVEAVYYGGYHTELGQILRQADAAGLELLFMGPEGVGNRDLNTIAGAAADGLLITLPPDFSQRPGNKHLVAELEAREIDASGPFVLTAYTAVQLIAEGLRQVGENPEEVARVLRQGRFSTPVGELSFRNNGDLNHFEFMVYRWNQDGTRTLLSEPLPSAQP